MNEHEQRSGLSDAIVSALHARPGLRAALWRLLRRDGGRALREGLQSIPSRELEAFLDELLSEDGDRAFQRYALSRDAAPLRALLRADAYRALREALTRNGGEALKAVVLDLDPAWLGRLARARGGRAIAPVLFENGAELLRATCRHQGDGALAPVLAEDRRYLKGLSEAARNEIAGQLIRDGARVPAADFDAQPAALEQALAAPRAAAMAALAAKWEALADIVARDRPDIGARYRAALHAIESPEHVRGRVLDAITDGDVVHLAHGALRFSDRHALWTQIHEILLNEDYYFTCDSDAPVIIDAGAHMGLAIYYFKALYPHARITAFEPVPELCDLARENVARNGWEDVEILPFALASAAGRATFHRSRSWSMAGSLSAHRAEMGDALEPIEVECTRLSGYLRGPVDFLKLDIEGAEDAVLEEAAPMLGNVQNLFCEFHEGPGFARGRLAKILGILDTAGFDVQLGKSHNYQETSRVRPLAHVGGAASMVIWARRRG
ncbi:MAG: FkbM family methyltransferase [Candidatus Hydrogenedentes bacterium]|nr:FkbM family methyltransferase [Candidatus Hydrogenedentota bacterium]